MSIGPDLHWITDVRTMARRQRLRVDFKDYPEDTCPKVQDILGDFEFRNQLKCLSTTDALTSTDVNLSPKPVTWAVHATGLSGHRPNRTRHQT